MQMSRMGVARLPLSRGERTDRRKRIVSRGHESRLEVSRQGFANHSAQGRNQKYVQGFGVFSSSRSGEVVFTWWLSPPILSWDVT